MMVVKKLNIEVYKCIFYEGREDNIAKPIMVLSDYELSKFYNQLINEKKERENNEIGKNINP